MQNAIEQAFPLCAMCETAEYSETLQGSIRNITSFSSGPRNCKVLTLLACSLNIFIYCMKRMTQQ